MISGQRFMIGGVALFFAPLVQAVCDGDLIKPALISGRSCAQMEYMPYLYQDVRTDYDFVTWCSEHIARRKVMNWKHEMVYEDPNLHQYDMFGQEWYAWLGFNYRFASSCEEVIQYPDFIDDHGEFHQWIHGAYEACLISKEDKKTQISLHFTSTWWDENGLRSQETIFQVEMQPASSPHPALRVMLMKQYPFEGLSLRAVECDLVRPRARHSDMGAYEAATAAYYCENPNQGGIVHWDATCAKEDPWWDRPDGFSFDDDEEGESLIGIRASQGLLCKESIKWQMSDQNWAYTPHPSYENVWSIAKKAGEGIAAVFGGGGRRLV